MESGRLLAHSDEPSTASDEPRSSSSPSGGQPDHVPDGPDGHVHEVGGRGGERLGRDGDGADARRRARRRLAPRAAPCCRGRRRALPSALGQLKKIEPLDGTNFTEWKNGVLLNPGMLDYDLAIREDRPVEPQSAEEMHMDETDEQYINLKWSYDEKLAAWEKSNRMSLMYIKSNISPSIIRGITDSGNVKTYLANIDENFKSSSKTYASTLIIKMCSSQYNGKKGVRTHILELSHIAHQLRSLKIDLFDEFLVHFILNSLSSEYETFKVSYNTQKEKWSIAELISHAVEEEERKKAERQKQKEQLNLVSKNKRKANHNAQSNNKKSKPQNPQKNDGNNVGSPSSKTYAGPHCTFCDSDGHWMRDCPCFKAWLAKKGIPYRQDAKKRGADPKSG